MNDIVTPIPYTKVPYNVDAVQVTATNFLAVARWCEGTITSISDHTEVMDFAGLDPNEQYIKVNVRNPKNGRETRAYVNDYITHHERDGYRVVKSGFFNKAYTPLQTGIEKAMEVKDLVEGLGNPGVDPEDLLKAERETWIPEGEQQRFVPDETEKISEDAVRRMAETPSALVDSPPYGEHETDGNEPALTAEAEAMARLQAADVPLADSALQAALEMTGVKTATSRVCDLAVTADFVYDGVLYCVDSKSDALLQATSPSGNVLWFFDATTLSAENLEPGSVDWTVEVLTDAPDNIKPLSGVNMVEVHTMDGVTKGFIDHPEADPTAPLDPGEQIPQGD
jgi:hypothetical protein